MLSRNKIIHKPNITVDISKFEAMMHKMYSNESEVPIDYLTIHKHKRDDKELQAKRIDLTTARNYKLEEFGKYNLSTKTSSSEYKERIWIPEALRVQLLEWYHDNLQHPGARRLEESIRTNFTYPKLSQMCKDIASKCDICSQMKLTNVVKDGKIPLREDKIIKPWDLLSVDLCESWIVKCGFEEPQQIQEVKI